MVIGCVSVWLGAVELVVMPVGGAGLFDGDVRCDWPAGETFEFDSSAGSEDETNRDKMLMLRSSAAAAGGVSLAEASLGCMPCFIAALLRRPLVTEKTMRPPNSSAPTAGKASKVNNCADPAFPRNSSITILFVKFQSWRGNAYAAWQAHGLPRQISSTEMNYTLYSTRSGARFQPVAEKRRFLPAERG